MTDANDIGLAETAAALGRPDEADRFFGSAIELCERARARSYLARYRYDWARALADRGDTAMTREQGELAVALAEELDMTGPCGTVSRGRVLLASL